MIFSSCIGNRKPHALSVLLLIASAALAANAQRLSILAPGASPDAAVFAEALRAELSRSLRVDDLDMSRAAAASGLPGSTLNMTLEDARALGSLLGTPYYVLVDSGRARRSSSERPEYYEAFGVVYLVSSATGRLVDWHLESVEKPTAEAANSELLSKGTGRVATKLRAALATANSHEPPRFQQVPDPDDPAFAGLRPPMPYRRKSPVYTQTAFLYDVKATVEIEADIDETGNVVRSQIVRWAGYGLDDAVTDTVRSMQWRPATLKNTPLPMRVLLRYNFVKREKNDEDPVGN